MSFYLSTVLAKRVSDRMKRDGYAHCTPADVEEVWESGTLRCSSRQRDPAGVRRDRNRALVVTTHKLLVSLSASLLSLAVGVYALWKECK